MRDPHVEALHYKIGTGDGCSFGDPPPVAFTNHLGEFALADGTLTIRPRDHYANGEEARAVFDPFVRAWELHADLTKTLGSIRFTFAGVRKIDRHPPPPKAGSETLSVHGEDVLHLTEVVSMSIKQHEYPLPSPSFRTTPEVEQASRRWQAFCAGREPLQSMAYAVLTLVQSLAGDRQKAAAAFAIAPDILNTIGRLSSTKGDATTTRKFGAGLPLQPLTGTESHWLEAAVRRLVLRLGERAAGAPLTLLTMHDLPAL